MKKLLYLLLFAAVMTGCEKKEAELPTADDLTAYAGKYRAKLEFSVPAGTTACKIFYNSGSVKELPVTDATIRQSEILEGMAEGEQVLRVVTLNAAGEASLPRGVKVNVYGDTYQRTLAPRKLLDKVKGTNTLDLTFEAAAADEIGLWVVYTNTSGNPDSVQVSPAAITVHITGIKTEEGIRYYSVFRPEPDAFDEFMSVTSRGGIKASVTLVNAAPTFASMDVIHPWPDGPYLKKLAGWTHNAAALISLNTLDDRITMFSLPGGGINYVNNGKVYQAVSLQAGDHELTFHCDAIDGNAGVEAYGVVTKAAALPDYNAATTDGDVVGAIYLPDYQNKEAVITFTLDAPAIVQLGWVYNTSETSHGWQAFKISGLELYHIL